MNSSSIEFSWKGIKDKIGQEERKRERERVTSLTCDSKSILCPGEQLNLQMFHRSGPQHVQMPILSSQLRWPETERLHLEEHSWVVDLATRVSCRGSMTWWHLDDCGEFTIQAALPLKPQRQSSLTSASGLPVVKVFVFFPRDWYDMVFQDIEANKTGEASCIDLFDCSDEQLPTSLDGILMRMCCFCGVCVCVCVCLLVKGYHLLDLDERKKENGARLL